MDEETRAFNRTVVFVRFIEDGILLNPKDIDREYGISEKRLEKLIKQGMLPPPEPKFGTVWHFRNAIDLLLQHSEEEE